MPTFPESQALRSKIFLELHAFSQQIDNGNESDRNKGKDFLLA